MLKNCAEVSASLKPNCGRKAAVETSTIGCLCAIQYCGQQAPRLPLFTLYRNMLRQSYTPQSTQCTQCGKSIEEYASCFTDDSYRKHWCVECGEKQNNEEAERAYQEYLDTSSKGRSAFFRSLAVGVGVYIFVLGMWGQFNLAFLASCVAYLFLLFLKKEKVAILGDSAIGTAVAGLVGLYVATTFSVPLFCGAQDIFGIEFLSRTVCSGTLVFPGYMGL